MSEILDVYGRAITIVLGTPQGDIYTIDGVVVAFPSGTTQTQALSTLNGMAPAGHTTPKTSYSFLEFMALFTLTEQALIVVSNDVQVKLFVMMATGAGVIQLDDSEVVQGVEYLTTVNLITTARAAAILSGQALT